VADNPQQTIRELKDLVVAYFKQETLDPLKGLGRYILLGLAGAVLLGFGIFFLAMAALRALQTQTGDTFDDWMSFLPYVIVVVGLLIGAGLSWYAAQKKKAKAKADL
jgi:uncharacterized protein involved in cysteine biosynthesis